MEWPNEFIAIAGWCLRNLDLRYKFLHAEDPTKILTTSGIDRTPEQAVIFSIFEASIASHFVDEQHIRYEAPYPVAPNARSANPKRADLAFKDDGPGKNWGYVEVKKYSLGAKSHVARDIEKIKQLNKKCGRYMFLYRVSPVGGKSKSLAHVVEKNFSHELSHICGGEFDTFTNHGEAGRCEYALYRVRV